MEPACFSLAGLSRIEPMELHADFRQRAVLDSNALEWAPSPMAGVERRILDRRGEDVARATSLVCCAPGSHIEPHGHPGGEEIVLLDGVFQDKHGTYPAGSWLRNPPGSVHRPRSEAGCTIWVKTGHLQATQGVDRSKV